MSLLDLAGARGLVAGIANSIAHGRGNAQRAVP
jgi:hypothetical protein